MDWDDLRVFLAVAQTGSIRNAARKLRVNHSTVSRRIKAFEQKTGHSLFMRTQTGYTLTSRGEAYLELAANLEEQINDVERRIIGNDNELHGELRVTLPQVLATHLMICSTRIQPYIC